MASDWSGAIATVSMAAGSTPKQMFCITAAANSDIIVRDITMNLADSSTSNVVARLCRATGTATGGSAVTFVNSDTGSSETQRFTVTAGHTGGMTLGGVVAHKVVASNYGIEQFNAAGGLNEAGWKLRGGESLVLELTGASGHTVSATTFTMLICQ